MEDVGLMQILGYVFFGLVALFLIIELARKNSDRTDRVELTPETKALLEAPETSPTPESQTDAAEPGSAADAADTKPIKLSQRDLTATQFKLSELQKRLSVLTATKADVERQLDKLAGAMPEDEVAEDAQKEGYLAYGEYAKAVIARKATLRESRDAIDGQIKTLAGELRTTLDTLDSFERVRARQMAEKTNRKG